MASYQPTILPPRKTVGDALSGGMDIYLEAMMKKKLAGMDEAEKQKRMEQAYQEFSKKYGDKNIKAKIGPEGISYETKDTPDFKENDFVNAALGSPRAMRSVADEFAIKQKTADDNPLAAMSLATGGVGDVAGNELQGEPDEEFAKRVMEFSEGGIGKINKLKKPTLNAETLEVIQNIKGDEDLKNLLKDRKEYEAEGVDVEAVLNYYYK